MRPTAQRQRLRMVKSRMRDPRCFVRQIHDHRRKQLCSCGRSPRGITSASPPSKNT
jgi:hypothetical protein